MSGDCTFLSCNCMLVNMFIKKKKKKKILSKKSLDHLIPPSVFDILKHLLKDTTGFQICHCGSILELVLHAKLYQRLSICLKTLLLPRDYYQRLIYFVGDRKELIYARVTRSKA